MNEQCGYVRIYLFIYFSDDLNISGHMVYDAGGRDC